MKSKYLLIAICLIAWAFRVEAACCDYDYSCNQGIYGSILGGVNFLDVKKSHTRIDSKTGFLGGAAVGYKFNPYFRAEVELAYRGNKIHSTHTHLWTLIGNGFLEYPLAYGITPYIGFGMGTGHLEVKNRNYKDKDNGFVWQAIAGASYSICDRTDIALDYRYLDAQKDAYNHAVCLSLRYAF